MTNQSSQDYTTAVAIIGMSGRFPGARNVEQFWNNIAGGVRSIRFFSDEELLAAGVEPETLRDPNFVKAGTVIEDADRFDARFFGYPPREAETMDPQHRLFLECAWEALERAAYDPETYKGLIGVFAGSCYPTYMHNNLLSNLELVDDVGLLQINVGNEADSLSSTVSYKLNLRGPSIAVQTFCSTSLVAVHLAYQSLITYESDITLAGGVAVAFPQGSGYSYQEGGIVSPDGYCRTFDAQAQGSVMGNGLGVVVLKRMTEALADGDQIYAVIRGSAINNDGIRKVGYTAPGLAGQTSVVVRGLSNAGVKAETISYIEAHGTATPLGDSVELASLIRAFSRGTKKKQFCALGSVKPNIGHLDRASGVTGLIKTALALTHKQLPPLLHFEQPSPDIDLANSPFYVNTELREWPRNGTPRRAGVSSFGLGGTNVHVVLEEAPENRRSGSSRPHHLLLLSAKTETALEAMTTNLIDHCRQQPDLNPADLAYTLKIGRSAFNHRRALVFRDLADLTTALEARDPGRVSTLNQTGRDRPVVFLFPGVGEHYVGMAHELYQQEAAFRAAVDRCAEALRPQLGMDIRAALYPQPGHAAGLESLEQPALFVVEYALAQLLMTWGIKPQAMLGYGVGEYVAACVSGVLTLEDALRLVATRAQLRQSLPAGTLLSVTLSEAEIQPYLSDQISLAAIHGPARCVLAGASAAIGAVSDRLQSAGVACQPIAAGHALDAPHVSPLAAQITALARGLKLSPPQIPYLSNVTGTWITPEQASDPAYWAQHMVQPIRLADGLQTLLLQAPQVLLEVGPGQMLSALVRQHPACAAERMDLLQSTLPAADQQQSDIAGILAALGKLWLLGVAIDWNGFYADETRLRIALPTYPFERQRFWIESSARAAKLAQQAAVGKRPDLAEWFYQPVWQPTPLAKPDTLTGRWLILEDTHGIGAAMAQRLSRAGMPVVRVVPGDHFAQQDAGCFQVRPDSPADYHDLLAALRDSALLPTHVAHLWSLDPLAESSGPDHFSAAQQRGFYSLLFLTQALSAHLLVEPLQMLVASNGVHAAVDGDISAAEHGTLPGLCTVIGQEHVNITCQSVDLTLPAHADYTEIVESLLAEAQAGRGDSAVAYRNGGRLTQSYTPLRLEAAPSILRQGGVYLITGGLGGIGLVLAEYLARTFRARLVLGARVALPPREAWADWLADHPADDRTSSRIRKVQDLEALGAEVLVLQADVADIAQMRAALDATHDRFGALNGVFYTAGTSDPSAFGALESLSREQCEAHFQPKGYGLYVLEDVLRDEPLDFCLLFSSLSALLGGLTLGAYAAGNSFIDAFVQRHNGQHAVPWLSVNWDTWQLRANQHAVIGATVAQFEMLPAEGAQAVERLIATRGYARIVNSTGDLEARINQWIRMEALRTEAMADDRAGTELLTSGDYEQRITAIWKGVLGIEEVGLHDNFFDLGGNSLNGLQVMSKIKKTFKVQIPVVALFEAPTVSALAQYLRPKDAPQVDRQETQLRQRRQRTRQAVETQDIAIIGMAGRFPGANTVEQFWSNIRDSVESKTYFSDAELLASGVDPLLIQNPDYVKSRPILDDVEHFDAAFFGYTPREAEMMDPQQRIFHECAWEALETAGYDTQRYKGLIGVFAGANLNVYLMQMFADPALRSQIDDSTVLENDKDALATNVAYKLNLRGPSFAVQTFCSTSLVATHLACRSLLDGECDMALAGGVSVRVPVKAGYLYVQGDQVSPDGCCRTFDARSEGATFGDGAAIVVLKRLDDALADGDTIHAVIKGSAINNDGGRKVGYTAPSVTGQAEVVTTA
ncbi:MAG TPA: beta-ketoacyl synthase N-terminal-like domain-containing protein, partial [Herpetosiphonaceae bacterium]